MDRPTSEKFVFYLGGWLNISSITSRSSTRMQSGTAALQAAGHGGAFGLDLEAFLFF
jgi:hypothetical protein